VETDRNDQIHCRVYGGKKAERVVDEVARWLTVHSSAKTVVFHAGINDLLNPNGDASTEEALLEVERQVRRVIKLCADRSVRLAICAVPPVPLCLESATEMNKRIQKIISDTGSDDVVYLNTSLSASFLQRDQSTL
jgi:lysophospholipase L1-like esterase